MFIAIPELVIDETVQLVVHVLPAAFLPVTTPKTVCTAIGKLTVLCTTPHCLDANDNDVSCTAISLKNQTVYGDGFGSKG